MLIPKDCVHKDCKNIIYVPKHLLHQMLICQKCITKKKQDEKDTIL